MLRFTVRRLLLLVPILLGLSILVFVWIRRLPGSPAEAILGERATEQAVAKRGSNTVSTTRSTSSTCATCRASPKAISGQAPIRTDSSPTRSGSDFQQLSNLRSSRCCSRSPSAFRSGSIAAKRHGGAFDHFSLFASLIGVSIPIFFLAILLKYAFAVKLAWLPSVGRQDVLITAEHPTDFYVLDGIVTGDWNAAWDAFKHLILPAIALGSIPLAIIARITRASALDVQNEDYVRTARAKGLSPQAVDRGHVFRNAMLPVVTVIGLQAGLLLSGAILTETVFAFPGMGTWVQEAIKHRDYPVLQGGILFIAIVVVLINLAVDIAYGFLDPRIRLSGR